MNSRYEMRFTGSGGQGVILASVILAEAAILSDLSAVQSQAYGPEARGGLCRAETIISRDRIWFTKVIQPGFLLALTQPSLNRYAGNLAEGATVMMDDSLAVPNSLRAGKVLRLPILRTARETVGRAMTANIVAVGAINAALDLFSDEVLAEAVKRHIPAGTEALNLKALAAGKALLRAPQPQPEAAETDLEAAARRIRCRGLEGKFRSAGEAAALIRDGMTVAVSGFTPSGCPKAVPSALAGQVASGRRKVRINLLSGASTGDEIDTLLGTAGIISRRAPYITSDGFRKIVNGGGPSPVAYQDVHLGAMAQNTRYGQYGKIDVAVVEACAITEDGGLVPTTAVGCAQTFVALAEKVIVELNLTQPAALEGFHDLYAVQDPPLRQPIPLTEADQRIGGTSIPCGVDKIAAVVVSRQQEKPRALAKVNENSRAIAGYIVAFLESERAAGRLSADRVPLQSGVGSVANAVLDGLNSSGFDHLRFYSEVMQDAILDLMDCGKADFCSATSLCLSADGMAKLLANLDRYRGKILLRDSEVSNSAEVIRRLGVIAMNTAIEVDLYGNVNSSHMNGSRIYNGIGGSGDYARNASVTIFMANSTAKDGKISSIVPMVTHVDHTEHDVDVIVTEQGIADLRGKCPRERAELIIERCAHPSYRPQLRAYFQEACAACGNAQTPQLLNRCFAFHRHLEETGTMLLPEKEVRHGKSA